MSIDYSSLDAPVTKEDIQKYNGESYQNRYKTGSLIFAGILIVWGIFFVVISDSVLGFIGRFLLVVTVISVMAMYFLYLARQGVNRQTIIKRFADNNGFKAFFSVKDPQKPGMIFEAGHNRNLNEAVILSDDTEIGNYSYDTGGGKNRQTHNFSYVAIKLPRKLPHMVLDSKSNNFFGISNLPTSFNRGQQLQLEGDFNKYFDVYVPEGYERDALYVFTPDIMQMMMDSSLYDIEIIDDILYIYGEKLDLTNRSIMRSVIEQIQKINQKFDRRVDYYMDERVESREANVVAPGGSKLKKGVPWAIVIFVGIVVLLQVVPFVINFLTIIFISN